MPKTSWTLLLVAMLILPICALADNTGTDWSLGAGGTYSWSGGSSSLIASGISVGSVSGIGSNTAFSISSGALSFTSGAYNGNGTNWSWGGDGTFNITGCIAGVSTGNCSTNVLLSSSDFSSISIVPVLKLGQYSFDVQFGDLTGTINDAVASAFGISDQFAATSLNLIFTTGNVGGPFTGTNLGGLVQANATPAVSASEDASLIGGLAFYLIAAGVFGLAWRFGLLKPRVS